MPNVINIGAVNINTPQQNSSIFFGETILTGMDANMKFNTGHGGTFGFFNLVSANLNNNFDSFELADGNMYDQDFKGNIGSTV